MCFEVHGLPHRCSLSGIVGRIFFDDVARISHDVESFFDQLSIPFCRVQAFAAGTVDNAHFSI